jgi:hypothetical protein
LPAPERGGVHLDAGRGRQPNGVSVPGQPRQRSEHLPCIKPEQTSRGSGTAAAYTHQTTTSEPNDMPDAETSKPVTLSRDELYSRRRPAKHHGAGGGSEGSVQAPRRADIVARSETIRCRRFATRSPPPSTGSPGSDFVNSRRPRVRPPIMIEMSAAYGISIGGAVYRPLCASSGPSL